MTDASDPQAILDGLASAKASVPSVQVPRVYAVFERSNRRVMAFVHSQEAQDAQAHPDPDLDVVATQLTSMPPASSLGYQVAEDGTVSPYAGLMDDLVALKLREADAHFKSLFAAPAGFTYRGSLVQIDEGQSQPRIDSATSRALAAVTNPGLSPWPSDFAWVAADNSLIPLPTPEDMVHFGQTVFDYVRACILHYGGTVKASIRSAATAEQLAAIDVAAGYPDASAV